MSHVLSLIFILAAWPALAEPRPSDSRLVQPVVQNNDPGWSPELRKEIPDVIAVDLALRQAGLKPRDASMVYGRTTWVADDSGLVHRHATIGWRQLAGPHVVDETKARQGQARRVCSVVNGHDPVPGGRKLQLFRQDLPRDGELDSERRSPRFILGTGPRSEVLITALRPGDQIQITEAIPPNGGAPREHLELRRGGRSLTVTRLGQSSRVCMADAS